MESIKYPIIAATAFVLIFTMLPFMGAGYALMAFLFVLSPFVTLWLVYKILKDAEPSGQTFDDYWYEDYARDN